MIPDRQSLNQATDGKRETRRKKLPYRLSAGAAMTIHIPLMTPEICLLIIPHTAPAAQRQTAAAARANSLLRRRSRSFEWLSFRCLRDFHEFASVPTPLYSYIPFFSPVDFILFMQPTSLFEAQQTAIPRKLLPSCDFMGTTFFSMTRLTNHVSY